MKKAVLHVGFVFMGSYAWGQPGNPDTPVTLDAVITVLIAAGAAYGAKKLYKK